MLRLMLTDARIVPGASKPPGGVAALIDIRKSGGFP